MIAELLFSLLLTTGALGGLPERMPPTDSCAQDAGFAAFRQSLEAAIARRDAAIILDVATDDIDYSFGEMEGRAGFARRWGLAAPATSPFWDELAAALRLGCARDEGGAFWAPSMSLIGNEDLGEDYFSAMVAVAPGAALRAGPADDAPVVAPLRWHVVALEDGYGEAPWLRARLADGRRGYIRRDLFRSFGDFRATFEYREGRWRMTAFVGGD